MEKLLQDLQDLSWWFKAVPLAILAALIKDLIYSLVSGKLR